MLIILKVNATPYTPAIRPHHPIPFDRHLKQARFQNGPFAATHPREDQLRQRFKTLWATSSHISIFGCSINEVPRTWFGPRRKTSGRLRVERSE